MAIHGCRCQSLSPAAIRRSKTRGTYPFPCTTPPRPPPPPPPPPPTSQSAFRSGAESLLSAPMPSKSARDQNKGGKESWSFPRKETFLSSLFAGFCTRLVFKQTSPSATNQFPLSRRSRPRERRETYTTKVFSKSKRKKKQEEGEEERKKTKQKKCLTSSSLCARPAAARRP